MQEFSLAMVESQHGLSAAHSLPVLLTTESLLFAAFGVSVGLTTPVEGGRPPIIASGVLAALIAVIIWVVAIGAAAAWISVYTSPGPCGFSETIQALCLAAGIAMQPLVAAVIAWNIRTGV
jgi:hypothetical protein